MRKSIDGLSALVEQERALSPGMAALSPKSTYFWLCSAIVAAIRLSERNGFIVWYKRPGKAAFSVAVFSRDRNPYRTGIELAVGWL